MRPRIFVSSTYYDLKYIRESIEKLLELYLFESVLFESNQVIFESGESLDKSCYNEVQKCHMMILIIGGRYGSAATNPGDYIKKYEEDYVSITKQEYLTAIKSDKPVMIFVDKNVYIEYRTYQKNIEVIKKDSNAIKFANVDSVNVFRFIDELSSRAIFSFERFEDIENAIKNQFAGYFANYFDSKSEQVYLKKIDDKIADLNASINQLEPVINALGKNGIDSSEFERIIKQQANAKITNFAEKLIGSLVSAIDIFNLNIRFYDETFEVLCGKIYDILYSPHSFETVQNVIEYFFHGLKHNYYENEKLVFSTDLLSCCSKLLNAEIESLINSSEYKTIIIEALVDAFDSNVLPF